MKLLLVFSLWALALTALEAKNCTEEIEKECQDTEYHSYVDCIRKRTKRSLICDGEDGENCEECEDSCQLCDCDYCAVNTCQPKCTSCCPENPPCTTSHCCHKTCHARCKSFTCRSECRKSCGNKIVAEGNSTFTNITSSQTFRHNITTVINLHNVINNTNVIDIPVHVNNTNINNITISSGKGSSAMVENVNCSYAEIVKEPCCYALSPRQCVPTEKYPYIRCFHLRRKVCGVFCRAPIVHEQPHEVCDQMGASTTCQQQIAYIPQPQPRCTYKNTWPFVSCGLQQQPFCGGCYAHYSSPYPQLPPLGCSPACYDDGYGMGPYYRQGPFYRPGFAHVPSCYQLGSCGLYGFEGGYFGGYGYPAPNYGGYGGFPAFPGLGYPPNTYENNFHVQTNPNNVVPQEKEKLKNHSKNEVEVEDPLPAYYPVPIIPQYSAVGYPYFPQNSLYYLPPEVDIRASISQPEKASRYAKITITNGPDEEDDKESHENSVDKPDSKVSST